MFWKNWPYWLKGGLILGLSAFIINLVIIIIFKFDSNCYPGLNMNCGWSGVDGVPFDQDFGLIVYPIIYFVVFFIVGSAIGLFYKRKKYN